MSEWIKIESELPAQIHPVLIIWKGVVQRITYELRYISCDKYVFTPHFFGSDDIGEVKSKDVSHWMPLPEPPSESR